LQHIITYRPTSGPASKESQICINILQMSYLLFTPCHLILPPISPPPKMAASSGLFLATIYNQSKLAERKHVARYWLINTAATAVPLSAHPSPLVATKLAAAIFGGGCTEEVFCQPSTASVESTNRRVMITGHKTAMHTISAHAPWRQVMSHKDTKVTTLWHYTIAQSH